MTAPIGLTSDHAGEKLKLDIAEYLDSQKIVYIDYTKKNSTNSSDYPDLAKELAKNVSNSVVSAGIAICGTGIGMAISCNKFKNVRAASVWDEFSCRMSKEHNDANILCLGSRCLETEYALKLVKLWFECKFAGERHQRRVAKIKEIEDANFFSKKIDKDPSMKPWDSIRNNDQELHSLIDAEFKRQQEGLEMIASENFAPAELISAMGNVFANKYAEGRPYKRYYGGCEVVDKMEDLAIKRVCSLYSCQYANVQPHSGAQANAAVMLGLIPPQSKILGLNLSHGGHLTHGSKVNFSGTYYEAHFYGVNEETERLDYAAIRKQANDLKPKLIIAGASAYPRQIDFAEFRSIADEVGAYLLVDMSHIAGLVAAQEHPNPFPHAHIVTSTTHKTLRGPRGGIILWNDENLSAALNKGVFPGTQGGPLEHIIATKAYCFKLAHEKEFKAYQQQTINNAKALAKALEELKLRPVSGGTDNHLVLIDLSNLNITGKELEEELDKVYITVNKNTIPNEKRSPLSQVALG